MKSNNYFVLMALICLMSWIKPDAVLSQPLTDSTVNYFTLSAYYDQFYDSLVGIRGIDSMTGTGYKDYLRWKWFYSTRHSYDGDLGKMWDFKDEHPYGIPLVENYIDESDWQFVGPLGIPLGHGGAARYGTGKGMMLSIWVSKGDHSLIYAGSHHGGLWKTNDGGDNWFPLHDNDARIHGVNSIAVDPEDNDIIYITCNNSLSIFSDYSAGLYKSTDGGMDWHKLDVPDSNAYPTSYWGTTVRQVKIHPGASNTLFFITYKNAYISKDHGQSWDTIFNKNYFKWYDTVSTNFDGHNGLYDLEVDYLNDSLFYLAGSEIFLIKDSLNIIDTVNISSDVFLLGLNQGDSLLNVPQRAAVAVDSHFPGKAWFCYVGDYKRNNIDSISLVRIVEYSSIKHSFDLIFEKQNTIRASGSMLDFEVSHTDTNRVDFYYGAVGLCKTETRNGLDSSIALDTGGYPGNCWLHLDKRDLMLFSDGLGNDTLYIANDAGISWGTPFESGQTGCGDNIWHWRHPMNSLTNGLNVTEFYGIGISENQPELIAGGCQDINDMLLLDDTWINFGLGDGSQLLFDPNNDSIIYFSEWQNSILYRTNDYGRTFVQSGFHDLGASNVFIPLELDPINPSILYSGGKDLLKFSGVNDFSHDVEDPESLEHFSNLISDIEVVKNGSSRRIYISTDKAYYPWDNPAPPDSLHYTGCIYYSDNNGSTFTDISDSLEGCLNGFISDIEVNPDTISQIWVAFAVYSMNSDQQNKVFRSLDSGSNWEPFSQNLPEGLPVLKIKYIPDYQLLLAATDVGIYKRSPADTAWFPYSQNLPKKIITDIEVNPKHNVIIASTYGRGIWKSPLYCSFVDSPLVISNDTTWESDAILDRSIVITDSATLTIQNCKLFMPAEAKVIVERRSRLILDSCLLTSACNDLWWGIEVWGDNVTMQPSNWQGKVEVRNQATIEKSRDAIFVGKRDDHGDTDLRYSGGAVDAQDAVFRNNRNGITFCPYRYANYSLVKHCKFQTTTILADGSDPENFISLMQVHGIKIQGCDFNYLIEGQPDYEKHGIGIYAVDAGFEVTPDSNLNQTTFDNLEYGIFAMKMFENQPVEIFGSAFRNNLTGIYASAIENMQIYLNDFKMSPDSVPEGSDIFGGVYLDHCTGYLIQENTFGWVNPLLSISPSIGLTVNNSGEAYNEIYKNTFSKLYIATLAQNINRNTKSSFAGLKLICNVYNQNEYDIAVTGSQGCGECGISKIQGSSTFPAGNLFSKTGTHPISDFDNQMDSVYYFHHRFILGDTNRWIPYYISDSVYLIPTQEQWSDTTCSSRLPSRNKEFSKNLYETSLSTSDSLYNLLHQLVDGGNTTLLEMDIAFAEPDDALNLHEELLNFSPYLSDTILVKSVEKEDVLAPVMVKEIMVANPQGAKSPKVLEALENRENELPDYMMSEILLGKDSVGHKEILESDLSYWDLQKEISMNQLIHFYKMDTLSASHDSIILLLENANSLQAQYRLMMAYFENNDTVSALSTFENIPQQFDLNLAQSTIHQHWNSLVSIIIDSQRDTINLHGLDSIQLETLTDLSFVEDLPGNISRNILHHLELIETGPYYILPENQLKSGNYYPDPLIDQVIPQGSFVKLYPNPAKNYIILEYNLINDSDEGKINLYSSDGKLLFSKSLNRKKHDCIINTRDWEQGIYFYKFVLQGDKDQNGKIVILK